MDFSLRLLIIQYIHYDREKNERKLLKNAKILKPRKLF